MTNLRCFALASLLSLGFLGCTQPPASNAPNPAATVSSGIFGGATLPQKVDGLIGTAFLSISPDLTAALKNPPAPGAYFLVLAPEDPVKAILVCAGTVLTPEQLSKKLSAKMTLRGPVKNFADPAFKKMVKDKYQLDLASAGEEIQVVLAEGELFPASPSASASPAATASAAPTSSPAAAK